MSCNYWNTEKEQYEDLLCDGIIRPTLYTENEIADNKIFSLHKMNGDINTKIFVLICDMIRILNYPVFYCICQHPYIYRFGEEIGSIMK